MKNVRYTPLLLPLWLLIQLLPNGATVRVLMWARRHRKYFAWIES